MQLSLMEYSFTVPLQAGAMSTTDVIHFTYEVGVGAVELLDDAARDAAGRQAIRTALTETGVTLACYDIVGAFATSNSARHAAAVAAVEAACHRAADLGAPHVLLIPGPPEPDLPEATVRRAVARGLRACLPVVRQLGLTASLPNLGELAAYYGELQVVLDLLDAAGPELGLTYDVGNWLLADVDPLAALDRITSRIAHVHLKDWRVAPDGPDPEPGSFLGLDGRRYSGAALGEGVIDLAGALAALQQRDYPGYLSIEYEGLDDPGPPLRRGVAHARQLLAALPAAPPKRPH